MAACQQAMSELEQVKTAATARSDRGYLSNLQGPAGARSNARGPTAPPYEEYGTAPRLLRLRALQIFFPHAVKIPGSDVPSPIYPPESGRLLSLSFSRPACCLLLLLNETSLEQPKTTGVWSHAAS
jgi:hypothetical protein